MQSLFLENSGHCVSAEVVSCPSVGVCRVCALSSADCPLVPPQESAVLPLRPCPRGHTAGAPGTPSPLGTWSPTPVPRGWSWLGTRPCPAPLWMGRTAHGVGQCRGAKVQLGVCHSQLCLSLPQGTATAVAGLHPPVGRQLTPLL